MDLDLVFEWKRAASFFILFGIHLEQNARKTAQLKKPEDNCRENEKLELW